VQPAQLSIVIICQDAVNIEKGDTAEMRAGIGRERVKIRKCRYKTE
jgi:hypothetical protein